MVARQWSLDGNQSCHSSKRAPPPLDIILCGSFILYNSTGKMIRTPPWCCYIQPFSQLMAITQNNTAPLPRQPKGLLLIYLPPIIHRWSLIGSWVVAYRVKWTFHHLKCVHKSGQFPPWLCISHIQNWVVIFQYPPLTYGCSLPGHLLSDPQKIMVHQCWKYPQWIQSYVSAPALTSATASTSTSRKTGTTVRYIPDGQSTDRSHNHTLPTKL